MYHSLCNHSPTERHLDCFQFLAIMNKSVTNICVRFFYVNIVFISLRSRPKSAIAGSYGSHMFSFIRKCQNIFQSGCTILHSHQQCLSDSVSSSLPAFDVVTIFYFNHSDRCVVISHHG